MGCCERERDCCDLRGELEDLFVVAEKRRAQRDYLVDQVKMMAVELDELRCENRNLGELLKDRNGCRSRGEHYAHHHSPCGTGCRN